MTMIFLNQLGIISPLGNTLDETRRSLLEMAQSGVAFSDAYSPGRPLPFGRVDPCLVLPPMDRWPLPDRSRNNQLALVALKQIRTAVDEGIARFGPARVGVVIGTSTSGVGEAETALRDYVSTGALSEGFHYGQQELISSAAVLAAEIGVTGPSYVHSSACASSAKALASAARLIRMNACDAVVAGGVDTLCRFTVAGFAALESLSATRCNPLSHNRDGINIGEGAALFLVSREPATVSLRGWGESSDGYHMSAPDPAGVGARLALEQALARAAVTAAEIEYVNLHGTATVQNDAMEADLIHRVFGERVCVSSTKPFTGHALGAAGAIEAGLCWLAMQDDNPTGKLPRHLWDGIEDPNLPVLQLATSDTRLGHPPRWSVSNSFAFGGANVTLVFARD
jgi:3-oxoacyl-[acyl-carrier-protein] synthase I